MHRRWINTTLIVMVTALVGGCATSTKKLLTHDAETMLTVWRHATGDRSPSTGRVVDARQSLRRPLLDNELSSQINNPYTRTAQNEIEQLFHRLPNPDLVMYVFAHVAGTVAVPIPGYSMVFSFYQRVQYALPGERIEDF